MKLLILILICTSCIHSPSGTQDSGNNKKSELKMIQSELNDENRWWKIEADKMVNRQIVPRGIKDQNVIKAMKNIPRHLFIPKDLVKAAYTDGPLQIGQGQTISQPYVVALMTQLLELKGNEKVLEIGTGSGYQAAVLAQLADTCYSIELLKILADSAAVRLKLLGYHNVIVKCGDGYNGWPEHAPFDCIIVTAAPEEIPGKLVDQLKINGRMVVPVGKLSQNLILITKNEKGIVKKVVIPVRFVPMVKPE